MERTEQVGQIEDGQGGRQVGRENCTGEAGEDAYGLLGGKACLYNDVAFKEGVGL